MANLARGLLAWIATASWQGASAARNRGGKLGHEILTTIPMHLYKQDCGLSRPVALLATDTHAALEQGQRNPGAGMDQQSITPFTTVLKDGYYHVDCVKDYMFEHGDKYGDNKFSYELGAVANVSIVHYSLVPKENREPMSHGTCFAFCRTVPDMLFFGIHNGYDCYCTPYYKPMAGDSSSCDTACPGDTSTMCGGRSKSSIFSMHECQDAAAELAEASSRMQEVQAEIQILRTNLTAASAALQAAADVLQVSFGKVGDRTATALMMEAKKFAGELASAAKSAGTLDTTMTSLKSEEATFQSVDFSDFQVSSRVEDLVQKMEKTTTSGELEAEELAHLVDAAVPPSASGAAAQYYPVMYFVDKTKQDFPSTCGGDAAASPMPSTMEECAAACDAKVNGCVGFSFFAHLEGGLCFLLSNFESTTFYTGCRVAGANSTQCMAKLQHYSGTSLAPDGSGRCKQCLKTVTAADRCFL